MQAFTWRRVVPADFALLGSWLARPHVARWWNHETTAHAVQRDFGPAAAGQEPSQDLLVSHAGRPFGLVQRSWYADYPGYVAQLSHLVAVPAGAISVDYFVADPADTNRGLGTAMVRAVLEDTWSGPRDATAVIVPVAAGNRASWRLLERAGLTRVAAGDLEPDNPIDPPLHYVYRADRPDGPTGQTAGARTTAPPSGGAP